MSDFDPTAVRDPFNQRSRRGRLNDDIPIPRTKAAEQVAKEEYEQSLASSNTSANAGTTSPRISSYTDIDHIRAYRYETDKENVSANADTSAPTNDTTKPLRTFLKRSTKTVMPSAKTAPTAVAPPELPAQAAPLPRVSQVDVPVTVIVPGKRGHNRLPPTPADRFEGKSIGDIGDADTATVISVDNSSSATSSKNRTFLKRSARSVIPSKRPQTTRQAQHNVNPAEIYPASTVDVSNNRAAAKTTHRPVNMDEVPLPRTKAAPVITRDEEIATATSSSRSDEQTNMNDTVSHHSSARPFLKRSTKSFMPSATIAHTNSQDKSAPNTQQSAVTANTTTTATTNAAAANAGMPGAAIKRAVARPPASYENRVVVDAETESATNVDLSKPGKNFLKRSAPSVIPSHNSNATSSRTQPTTPPSATPQFPTTTPTLQAIQPQQPTLLQKLQQMKQTERIHSVINTICQELLANTSQQLPSTINSVTEMTQLLSFIDELTISESARKEMGFGATQKLVHSILVQQQRAIDVGVEQNKTTAMTIIHRLLDGLPRPSSFSILSSLILTALLQTPTPTAYITIASVMMIRWAKSIESIDQCDINSIVSSLERILNTLVPPIEVHKPPAKDIAEVIRTLIRVDLAAMQQALTAAVTDTPTFEFIAALIAEVEVPSLPQQRFRRLVATPTKTTPFADEVQRSPFSSAVVSTSSPMSLTRLMPTDMTSQLSQPSRAPVKVSAAPPTPVMYDDGTMEMTALVDEMAAANLAARQTENPLSPPLRQIHVKAQATPPSVQPLPQQTLAQLTSQHAALAPSVTASTVPVRRPVAVTRSTDTYAERFERLQRSIRAQSNYDEETNPPQSPYQPKSHSHAALQSDEPAIYQRQADVSSMQAKAVGLTYPHAANNNMSALLSTTATSTAIPTTDTFAQSDAWQSMRSRIRQRTNPLQSNTQTAITTKFINNNNNVSNNTISSQTTLNGHSPSLNAFHSSLSSLSSLITPNQSTSAPPPSSSPPPLPPTSLLTSSLQAPSSFSSSSLLLSGAYPVSTVPPLTSASALVSLRDRLQSIKRPLNTGVLNTDTKTNAATAAT